MAIKRNRRFHAEVATSSMSDIMFFLLLFFLIISTLANPNVIKMVLPQSKTTEKTQSQKVTVSVFLDVQGNKHYSIDKDEVSFDQLEPKILERMKGESDPTVVVRIPFDLKVQDLVDVLQIGIKNNLKFVLATEKK